MPVGIFKKIEWDSVPILDGWGHDYYWGPEDWMKWHQKLSGRFGQERANEVFIEWYHRASLGAANYDWRSFNVQFKNYAKASGFYSRLYDGIGGTVGKVATTIQNTTTKALDVTDQVVDSTSTVIENVGSAATGLTKYLSVVILGVIAFIIWRVTR